MKTVFGNFKRLWILFLLLLLYGLVSGCTSRSSDTSIYSNIIKTEQDWIVSLQVGSGAIKMASGPARYTEDGKAVYNIHPYFNNLAVLGILDNPNPKVIETAKKWISWYLNHINSSDYNGLSGTIYDYEYVEDGTEISKNYYDSVDAYAATFISLLRRYYEITHDDALLNENKEKIEKIIEVMISVQDNDGLTFAKPDYPIKYLMDNVEVYEGLSAAEYIAREVFNDTVKADKYKAHKEALLNAIESNLWNASSNSYYPYFGSPEANWSIFYPDATSQLFPIGFRLLSPSSERARYLYEKFNENYPGWPSLEKPDAFPWAFLAYVAALMGDKSRVDTFLNTIISRYINTGHPWTWYVAEAGWTIRAAKYVRDTLK